MNVITSLTMQASQVRLHELLQSGARPLEVSFSAADASLGQAEVILDDRRLFITPNDEAYAQYADTMREAGLPYVANNTELGTPEVIVSEIPRDAWPLPRIMRGVQVKDGGITSSDVFELLGNSINRLGVHGSIPDGESLHLNRILILRRQLACMITPPVGFVPDTKNKEQELLTAMTQELAHYQRFGAVALLDSFQRGLGYPYGR